MAAYLEMARQLPLETWSDLVGIPLSGHVTGDLRLATTQNKQSADLTLSGGELAYGDVHAGMLQLNGTLDDLFGQAKGRVLWMQRGLWLHLIVQALLAGSATLLLFAPLVGIDADGRTDLFGATVILAARIAQAAQGGEILVSDTVRGLCSGKGFSFKDRGQFEAKGFGEPIRLFEVAWRD